MLRPHALFMVPALSLLLASSVWFGAREPTESTQHPERSPRPAPSFMSAEEVEWRWAGFEVVGQKRITRDRVLEGVPIDLGTRAPKWGDETWRKEVDRWAAERRETLGVEALDARMLRFGEGAVYLVVEIVESDEAWRLEDTSCPKRKPEA